MLFRQHACAALAETHGATATAAAALHLAHHIKPEPNEQQHREPAYEYLQPQRLLFRRLGFHQHAVFEQVAD